MSLTHEMVRIDAPASVSKYTCDGCGASVVATFAAPGASVSLDGEKLSLFVPLPQGWTPVQLPGQPRMDLCVRCAANAVLTARKTAAAGREASAREVEAPTDGRAPVASPDGPAAASSAAQA